MFYSEFRPFCMKNYIVLHKIDNHIVQSYDGREHYNNRRRTNVLHEECFQRGLNVKLKLDKKKKKDAYFHLSAYKSCIWCI